MSSVQLLSCFSLFVTPRTAAHHASLSITNSWSLLKLMYIESVMPSNHLVLCHPLLLLPSIFLSVSVFSSNRVFSNESALHIRWLKYWNFSFSISPSSGYSGLISFRTGYRMWKLNSLNKVTATPSSRHRTAGLYDINFLNIL